jgi:hypothetical protein
LRLAYARAKVTAQSHRGAARCKHIITSETITALLLMAVASTMLTVPVVTPMLRRRAGVLARDR